MRAAGDHLDYPSKASLRSRSRPPASLSTFRSSNVIARLASPQRVVEAHPLLLDSRSRFVPLQPPLIVDLAQGHGFFVARIVNSPYRRRHVDIFGLLARRFTNGGWCCIGAEPSEADLAGQQARARVL